MQDGNFSRKSFIERGIHVPSVWTGIAIIQFFLGEGLFME
jgi:hypothetical protein